MLTALDGWEPKASDLLGAGGEAEVYAIGDDFVARLYRSSSTAVVQDAAHRVELCREIALGATSLQFETPDVVGESVYDGRPVHLERRLAGVSVLDALGHVIGAQREKLITSYLDTAWAIGEITIERPFLGEIGRSDSIRSASWGSYLGERAARSLVGSGFDDMDAQRLASDVEDLRESPTLVHLDYCPANVLTDGERVSAVIDFGYSTIIGDRRMNVAAAVTHLLAPQITPSVLAEDAALVRDWVADSRLTQYVDGAVPWLAAYWTFASDDTALMAWCESVLR